MGESDNIQPSGEKIRNAVRWISDMVKEHPEKERAVIVKEAEIRFDLNPKECAYLDRELES